jgi:hypothetical protein
MKWFTIGKLNGSWMIFGQGNTQRTAESSGVANAQDLGASDVRVVKENSLPRGAQWAF